MADHRAPTWQLPGEPRAPLWIGTGVETGGGFVELAQQLPDPPAGIVAPCCRLWARSVDERELLAARPPRTRPRSASATCQSHADGGARAER